MKTPGKRNFRWPRLAALFLATMALGGCTTLNEFDVLNHHDSRNFDGISSLLSQAKCKHPVHTDPGHIDPVHIVFVHGMGGYSKNTPDAIVNAILNLYPSLVKRPTTMTKLPDTDSQLGHLYETEYIVDCDDDGEGPVALRTFVIQWTNPNSPKHYIERIDQDPRYIKHRFRIFREIKSELLNKRLSDAILYAGTYRRSIRDTVRAGFAYMANRPDSRNAVNVIVTFSLGSSITFKVLQQMVDAGRAIDATNNKPNHADNKIKDQATFSEDFRKNTALFFMAANQILMFCLTGEIDENDKLYDPSQTDPCMANIDSSIKGFIDDRGDQKENQRKLPLPWIIAFSDPNDVLSYPLPPHFHRERPHDFLEVITSVSRKAFWLPYFGWVTHPVKAHTGYGNNKQVIKLMLDGYKHRDRNR